MYSDTFDDFWRHLKDYCCCLSIC